MSVSSKPDPGHNHHIIKRSVSRTRSGRRSDSDASAETASLSADGGGGGARRLTAPAAPSSVQGMQRSPRLERAPDPPNRGKKNRRRGSEWEVLEGLKGGQRFDLKPDVFNGYLHKKRKWPLKGWHKRYFVLECGILVYARTPRDISRGRLHGSVDVGLSVVSAEHSQRRIDIDAEEFIYHLKAKTPEAFRAWVSMLRTHRLYRQHLLTFGVRDSGRLDVNFVKFPKAIINNGSSSESDYKQSSPSKGSDDFMAGELPEDYSNILSLSPLSNTSRDDAYGCGYINIPDDTRTKNNMQWYLDTPHIPSFSPVSTVYNFLRADKPSCLTSSISSALSPPAALQRPKTEGGKRRTYVTKEKELNPKEKRNKSAPAKTPQTKANRPKPPDKKSPSTEKQNPENDKSNEFVKLPHKAKPADALKGKACQPSKLKQALAAVKEKNFRSSVTSMLMNSHIRHSKKTIDLTNFSLDMNKNQRIYDPCISYVKVSLDQQPSFGVNSFHMGEQFGENQRQLNVGSSDTFVIQNKSRSNSPNPNDTKQDRISIGGSDQSNLFIDGNFLNSFVNIASKFRDVAYVAASQTRDLDVTGVLKRLISKYGYNRLEESDLPADDLFLDRLSERLRANTKTNENNLPMFNLKTKVRGETEKAEVYSQDMYADLKEMCSCCLLNPVLAGMATENDTRAGFVSGTPGGTLSSWVIEEGSPLECVARELSAAQASVRQLQTMLDALELHHQRLHQNHDTDVSGYASVEGVSPGVRKDKRKFGLRKKKSSSKTSMDLMLPVSTTDAGHLSTSCGPAPPSPQASSTSAGSAMRPQSLPASSVGDVGPTSLTSLTPDRQLREDFTILAKDVTQTLTQALGVLVCEHERLCGGAGNDSVGGATGTNTGSEVGGAGAPTANAGRPRHGLTLIAGLRAHLDTALHHNSELRNRLARIHDASDLADISSAGALSEGAFRQLQPSMSFSSSCVSASEFFDAEEVPLSVSSQNLLQAMQKCDVLEVVNDEGDTSSEAGSLSTNDGSASSDNSTPPRHHSPPQNNNGLEDLAMLRSDKHDPDEVFRIEGVNGNGSVMSGLEEKRPMVWRRKRLPAPRPDNAGPSLWNLLCKNIGKDLSQISMPVSINEPLNMLQRLCEELEYSELLDKAAQTKDPVERLCLVAAFAVSAYGSAAHRAASKPFNPLLGETYECVRDDKGFRFIAEQVSHHPPVSACEAEGRSWRFWQDARIRTKFWGKSMEFQPAGRVNLYLDNFDDQYSWNKVTTCVHNLFAGQRWVDMYGELVITTTSPHLQCKLNFAKSSYWSAKRHEVQGWVSDGGERRIRLWGRWSEGLHCGEGANSRTLWMPNAMPVDYSLYYGFSQFAMELNELHSDEEALLPPTDTRLRPDQRALERGDLRMAELYKINLEQAQRDRKINGPSYNPKWFRKDGGGEEGVWHSNNRYWQVKAGSGFSSEQFLKLW